MLIKDVILYLHFVNMRAWNVAWRCYLFLFFGTFIPVNLMYHLHKYVHLFRISGPWKPLEPVLLCRFTAAIKGHQCDYELIDKKILTMTLIQFFFLRYRLTANFFEPFFFFVVLIYKFFSCFAAFCNGCISNVDARDAQKIMCPILLC